VSGYEHWIPKHKECPRPKVFLIGVALGVVSGAVVAGGLPTWARFPVFLVLLGVGVWYLYGRVRSTWPWYGYAGGHTLAWVGLTELVRGPFLVNLSGSLISRIALEITCAVVFALAESVACIFLGVLFLLVCPPYVKQDGTLCPNCFYSLAGNTTGRCPECGFEYALDGLGYGSPFQEVVRSGQGDSTGAKGSHRE
jgi:hypothetical protein